MIVAAWTRGTTRALPLVLALAVATCSSGAASAPATSTSTSPRSFSPPARRQGSRRHLEAEPAAAVFGRLRRRQERRPSAGGWWTSARGEQTPKRANTRQRLAPSASGRFVPAGFVASPPAPAVGQRRYSICTSTSSVAVGRFTEAGAWGPGRARAAGGRGGGRRRGGRSSDVVVVDGGAGDTEYYSWTETDSDLEVRVSLPPGTKAKSVQLSVTKTAVTLGLKGREGPVLKGSLKGQVLADESHWTMEEMDDTGEKVLYLCLEKAVDMEALAANTMPSDWGGVLEGEEPLNLYYPDKDKDFDVDAYVKSLGYDRDRDIDKVDKTMFSDLTDEMKQNLETTLPKSAFTDKDDMIPVMAEPKVSPVIDTGVLGLPTPPLREPQVVTDVTVNVNADGSVDDGGDETIRNDSPGHSEGDSDGGAVDAEVLRDESWAAGFAPDLGGAADGDGSGGEYSPARFKADAEFDVPVKGSEGGAGELTARQRELSAGLRDTYEKLVKRGMINDTNPDGTPAKVPDMDEMARAYETEGFMFKDGDFSEEELSKYMDMDMGLGMDLDADLPGGELDLSDPEVRSAFGLE
eukprot:g3257.t1